MLRYFHLPARGYIYVFTSKASQIFQQMNFKLFSFWWLINAAFCHCVNIPMERNITGSTISISYENYSTFPRDLSRFRKKWNDRYTASVFMSRILLRISKLSTNSLLRYIRPIIFLKIYSFWHSISEVSTFFLARL